METSPLRIWPEQISPRDPEAETSSFERPRWAMEPMLSIDTGELLRPRAL